MILLFGWSNFNEGNDIDSGAKENFWVFVDTTDGGHMLAVLHWELFEEAWKWVKAVTNIILVSVTTYIEISEKFGDIIII
jgi:hypothetical protein